MPRYFSRPRDWVADEPDWDFAEPRNVPTVSDHEPVDTGLLDSNGMSIMRAANPCGFGKDDEW